MLACAPQQAVWLGWSIAGMLVTQLAYQFPERVERLVLLAANLKFPVSDDWPHAVNMNILQRFHDDLVSDYQRTLQRFLALQVSGSDSARETLRQLRELMSDDLPPEQMTLDAGLAYLRDTDLREEATGLSQDVLWLAGERDTLVPVAAEKSIQALIPNLTTRVFQGAGHAPFLSHSDAFIKVMKDFAYE